MVYSQVNLSILKILFHYISIFFRCTMFLKNLFSMAYSPRGGRVVVYVTDPLMLEISRLLSLPHYKGSGRVFTYQCPHSGLFS